MGEGGRIMKKCMICGRPLDGDPLFQLHHAPASAQNLPDADTVENDSGTDLDLRQCAACGLIQFDCEPVPYFRDVIRGGGFSETMQNLRRSQYRHLIETYHLEHKKIIEIGCGEGEFVLPLTCFPVEAFGIEHSETLVRKAVNRGLNVWKAFAETPQTVIENAPFDAFLMFNFLEHQPRPNDMLRCIYNNLSEGGIGLVTVPSFDYVCEKNAFYELMRDHLAYYTEATFRFLMEYNGFEVLEHEIVNGDTLSAVVRKRGKTSMKGFQDNLTALKKCLSDFAEKKAREGKKIAVWGASHQAFAILSVTGFGAHVSYIIDSAAFKQNHFAPASHIPIVAPEHYFAEPADAIVIVAPGYAAEIAKAAKERFGSRIETYSLLGDKLFVI